MIKQQGMPGTKLAELSLKQLEGIGEPRVTKSTTTQELPSEGLDLGSLALMLYFALSGQDQGQTTETLLPTPLDTGGAVKTGTGEAGFGDIMGSSGARGLGDMSPQALLQLLMGVGQLGR